MSLFYGFGVALAWMVFSIDARLFFLLSLIGHQRFMIRSSAALIVNISYTL
jgi:hypothetical protein